MYVKAYTGYALSTGNEVLTSYESIKKDEYASSFRLKFGQGVNLGLSMGYDLNKNIAFEITGNTQLFSKFNYTKPYQGNSTNYFYWSSDGFFGDLECTNTLFQVSPQIVFRSNPYNQWTFYLKGGPNFAWIVCKETTQSISHVCYTASFYSSPVYYFPSVLSTTKYSGNINTGIQYSFGTEYKLSENICVFVEFTSVNIRYKFKRSKILRYEIDGVNALSTLNTTVSDELNNKKIFNHAGLNVGLKYIFR
jgi:hypothetical protein